MIITNSDLQHTAYAGRSTYYHTADIAFDPTENGADIHLVFTRGGHVAVADNSINVQMSVIEDMPNLLTRMEIQSPTQNGNLGKLFLLVNVSMPIQITKEDGTTLHPIHQRNGLVPESGHWTHASGLVSEDPRVALYTIAGLELGLTAGNKIILPAPPKTITDISPEFKGRLENSIRAYASKNTRLAEIFANEANPFVYAQMSPVDSSVSQAIYLEGTYKGSMQAVVVDNEDTKTITLFVPMQLSLIDENGDKIEGELDTFDLEGLDRKYALLTPEQYGAADILKTAALQEFIAKTSSPHP